MWLLCDVEATMANWCQRVKRTSVQTAAGTLAVNEDGARALQTVELSERRG